MKLDFFPQWINDLLLSFDNNSITEIRLRVGYPLLIKLLNNSYKVIGSFQISSNDIKYVIDYLTEKSLYAYNDNITQGFLTYKGIRVGLCGSCVADKENIITINNFTSLNIRIPHQIKGCSTLILQKIFNGQTPLSSLIVSKPGMGKTTILKDLAENLNNFNKYNILIIDERKEFEYIKGQFIDRIENSNKLYAFNYALRSLSPDIVITDEICDKVSMNCAQNCVNSGLKIIASCHCSSINELKNKDFFQKGVFDRYFFLSSKNIGQVDEIFDGNLEKI